MVNSRPDVPAIIGLVIFDGTETTEVVIDPSHKKRLSY
jgi:hypothetical protein